MSGFLVNFEGIDGSGKGTIIDLIRPKFPDAVFVRQPGSTPLAEAIRELAFNTLGTHDMDPGVWELLVKACIIQTEAEIIKPALAAGKLVIADRGVASSIAYMRAQHAKSPLPQPVVDLVEDFEHPRVDITFFFTCDKPGDMWKRAQGRTGQVRKQEAKAWNDMKHQENVDLHYRRYFRDLLISKRAGEYPVVYELDAFRDPKELANFVSGVIQKACK